MAISLLKELNPASVCSTNLCFSIWIASSTATNLLLQRHVLFSWSLPFFFGSALIIAILLCWLLKLEALLQAILVALQRLVHGVVIIILIFLLHYCLFGVLLAVPCSSSTISFFRFICALERRAIVCIFVSCRAVL